jgi:hypothetical protein
MDNNIENTPQELNDTEMSLLTANAVAPMEQTEISPEVLRLTPVLKIESGLSNFLQNAFDIAIKEQEFQRQIEAEIVSRLPTLKNQEIIALATSNRTNQNDLFSKLVAPTLQLATARQQNEMAQTQKVTETTISQTNIKEMNTLAPQDVLQGFKSLFDMVTVLRRPEEAVEYEEKE